MTYMLYNEDGAGGFVVEAGLAKAGLPHEVMVVDTKAGALNTPEFLALNPMRQIPALVLPDGTLMTETAAIIIQLTAMAGQGVLGPAPGSIEHARFLRWVVFMSVNLYEADLRFYYSDRYTDEPAGADGISRAAKSRLDDVLSILDAEISKNGGTLIDDTLSLADVYLSMLVAWYPGEHEFDAVKGVTTKVQTDPIYGPLWQRHFAVR